MSPFCVLVGGLFAGETVILPGRPPSRDGCGGAGLSVELPGGIDLLIVFLALVSLCAGLRAGLIRSCIHAAALVAGLLAATRFYTRGSDLLGARCGLPAGWADLVSLLLILILAGAPISLLGIRATARLRSRRFRVADRIGGAAAGLALGLMITGALLAMFNASPPGNSVRERLGSSQLAPHLAGSSAALLHRIEEAAPLRIPRLALHPQDPARFPWGETLAGDFRLIDFRTLDGATCFACQGKVVFRGYLINSHGSVSPKFVCTGCGRTSDGCQTYEGYHLLYGSCPAVLGREGYRFDCGIWSNGDYRRPVGRCPVCGASSSATGAEGHSTCNSASPPHPGSTPVRREP